MRPSLSPEVERRYDDVADEAMLAGMAVGDVEAFRQFHQRYAGLLYAAIQRILIDPNDTEEVLQEVLNSLWSKAHQYHSSRGRPITWLTSLARHRAIDRLRVRQRQSRLKQAYTEATRWGEGSPLLSSHATGSEVASRRDTCRIVRHAVQGLSAIQREAIEKVYFEGLTQQETAEQLGEPLGTVKARIRRGLEKLRESIAE